MNSIQYVTRAMPYSIVAKYYYICIAKRGLVVLIHLLLIDKTQIHLLRFKNITHQNVPHENYNGRLLSKKKI